MRTIIVRQEDFQGNSWGNTRMPLRTSAHPAGRRRDRPGEQMVDGIGGRGPARDPHAKHNDPDGI